MSNARVLLDPVVLDRQSHRPQRVAGAIVGVQDLLVLSSQRQDPQPAALRLFSRYLTAPRESPPRFIPFGSLECELAGSPGAPVLTVAPDAKVVLDAPATEEDPPPRQVFLKFPGTNGFVGRVVVDLPPPREDEEEALFFELGLELSVAGATQAPVELNDILDIPLLPRRIGLSVEWPNALDQKMPPSLILSVTQAGKVRSIAWSNGRVLGDLRQFFFRGIIGPAPVSLEAIVGDERITLWDQQDTSETQAKAPAWASTLEDNLFVQESGDVEFQVRGRLGTAKPAREPAPRLNEF